MMPTSEIMFAASTMVVGFVPAPVRSFVQSVLHYLFISLLNDATVIVDEQFGIGRNKLCDAAEVYLRTKISPNTRRFKVGATPKQKSLSISIEKGQEIIDRFENMQLKWRFVSIEPRNVGKEKHHLELPFDKKLRETVLTRYLPFVMDKAQEIKNNEREVRLYTQGQRNRDGNGIWGSVIFDHPTTFETLAMDEDLKKDIKNDLDMFVSRREFYKKVGKAWKRGYLLYGPPGTGKSSLIAAMANYLKFDIYDLELTSCFSNSGLREILLSITNRSIIAIEDIDCSVKLQSREKQVGQKISKTQLTLSGLLNFIDGLLSSCGDERIIIFTTNHKDRLDPALLRPGRMDMHIPMSYCTSQGFKLLASNYLQNHDDQHRLFGEIQGLIDQVQVTPAEVAGELMKSEDRDVALERVVNFLKKRKKTEADEDGTKEEPDAQRQRTSSSVRRRFGGKKGC